jgi:hypothetical protein
MTGDHFQVLTGELDAHAGKVDGLTDRLRTAAEAANAVTMNNDAFGVVCQPFAALLQPFEEMGVRTLREATEALTSSAGKVRDTSRAYGERESSETTVYRNAESGMTNGSEGEV